MRIVLKADIAIFMVPVPVTVLQLGFLGAGKTTLLDTFSATEGLCAVLY